MTKPIPDGAPRKRPARSCLACRASKLKCLEGQGPQDGEAFRKCSRCENSGGVCLWTGSKRFGRPRRRAAVLDSEHEGSSGDSSGNDLDDLRPSFALTTLDTLSLNHLFPPPSPAAFAAPTPLPVPPLSSPILSHFPDLSDISTLAHSYLTLLHPFVPLLPDRHYELVHHLGSTTPLLRLAIHTLLDGTGAFPPLPLANLAGNIGECQAAVLFLHAAYSRGREETARELLAWLSATMVAARWHVIDAPGQRCDLDPMYRQAIRLLWWECWGIEVMLGTVTGLRTRALVGIAHQVQTSDTADNNESPLALRVRALSLLASATKPPPDDPAEAAARETALNSIATNLTLISHQSYLSSSAAFATSPLGDQPRIAAQCEAAFTASLISSAATIFLHSSSSHFSSFIAPYSACGLDTSTTPPPSTHPHLRLASSHIFTLLRTSLSLSPSAPPPTHSPFFGCALLVAAQGALLGAQSDQRGEWRSLQVLSDLELAEWVLDVQATRWSIAGTVLGQVKALKAATFRGVGLGDQLLLSQGV